MQRFLFIVVFCYCLQLVSYPYFITDCLLSSVRLSFSLLRLVLVWYWHWWQGLWKLYGIKDFNIIKTFLKEKNHYIVIYIVIVMYNFSYRDIRFWSYRPPPPLKPLFSSDLSSWWCVSPQTHPHPGQRNEVFGDRHHFTEGESPYGRHIPLNQIMFNALVEFAYT